MAFLDLIEGVPGRALAAVSAAPAPRFSPLEWQVIAIAERDPLSSLRRPGRVASAMAAVFKTHNPRLADPKLEALRRMAVLSWRNGYVVPGREVRAFTDAGYGLDHYELLLDSINQARSARRRAA